MEREMLLLLTQPLGFPAAVVGTSLTLISFHAHSKQQEPFIDDGTKIRKESPVAKPYRH